MELSGDEQDSLAANCPDCWARPGEKCWVLRKGVRIKRQRGHPHPNRIGRAERRGILNGAGRILLKRKAYGAVKEMVT